MISSPHSSRPVCTKSCPTTYPDAPSHLSTDLKPPSKRAVECAEDAPEDAKRVKRASSSHFTASIADELHSASPPSQKLTGIAQNSPSSAKASTRSACTTASLSWSLPSLVSFDGASTVESSLSSSRSYCEGAARVHSLWPISNIEERRIMKRWYSAATVEASRNAMGLHRCRGESSKQGAGREQTLFRSLDTTPTDLVCANNIFPSSAIDITCLEVEVSVEEILTFFPTHLTWGSVMTRLLRNGWDEITIASYLNYARNWKAGDEAFSYTPNMIKRYVDDAMQQQFGCTYSSQARRGAGFREQWPPMSDLTPRHFIYEGHGMKGQGVSLIKLAQGVVFMPAGLARGALTLAIELAVADGDSAYSLGDVNVLAGMMGRVCALRPTFDGSNHDTDALQRARVVLDNNVWQGG